MDNLDFIQTWKDLDMRFCKIENMLYKICTNTNQLNSDLTSIKGQLGLKPDLILQQNNHFVQGPGTGDFQRKGGLQSMDTAPNNEFPSPLFEKKSQSADPEGQIASLPNNNAKTNALRKDACEDSKELISIKDTDSGQIKPATNQRITLADFKRRPPLHDYSDEDSVESASSFHLPPPPLGRISTFSSRESSSEWQRAASRESTQSRGSLQQRHSRLNLLLERQRSNASWSKYIKENAGTSGGRHRMWTDLLRGTFGIQPRNNPLGVEGSKIIDPFSPFHGGTTFFHANSAELYFVQSPNMPSRAVQSLDDVLVFS